VATAGLSPADIAVPIRSIIGAYKNTEVILGTVYEINIGEKYIICDQHKIYYDYLIVATGVQHSYFGHTNWEQFAPGLKSLDQAIEIRKSILLSYERAEVESDKSFKELLMTFIIIGGGPTGVELAGAIAEISRQTLVKDFKTIDPKQSKVILIEAGPRILSAFEPQLSQRAKEDLESMGVQVLVSTRVTDVQLNCVILESQVIRAATIIWAAGVQPSGLSCFLGNMHDQIGRVIVNSTLNIVDHPEVFVIGDLSYFIDEFGKPLPGIAPVAIQQGELAAINILNSIHNRKYNEFKYNDKGMMATIGRKRAVLQFRHIYISGFLAWISWLFIHILYLLDFKNKLFVFLNWCWSYFTLKRGARLIMGKTAIVANSELTENKNENCLQN
jgi:NADH dehydrogenase